jgi:hypothetical protein
MAVRDAVLSQSPEFKEARIHAYDNATAIYDLLTIALVRWGHADLLNEVCYSVTEELRSFSHVLLGFLCSRHKNESHSLMSVYVQCNSICI